jgi:molybdenum cofactor cytidylyltransferase
MNIGIIVLAAGSSTRMGRSKQLLEIDGEPLICRCIKIGLAVSTDNIVVVLGANEKPHREVIGQLPVHIIMNHYWKTGMGSSIKTALNYLLQTGAQLDAVIILVCDQPALSSEHLQKMIDLFAGSQKPIIASAYSNSKGVPVLFGRSFFSNLLLLGDDQGAKKLVQQFPDRVEVVDFPNGAFDLDTEEDYQNYLRSN